MAWGYKLVSTSTSCSKPGVSSARNSGGTRLPRSRGLSPQRKRHEMSPAALLKQELEVASPCIDVCRIDAGRGDFQLLFEQSSRAHLMPLSLRREPARPWKSGPARVARR